MKTFSQNPTPCRWPNQILSTPSGESLTKPISYATFSSNGKCLVLCLAIVLGQAMAAQQDGFSEPTFHFTGIERVSDGIVLSWEMTGIGPIELKASDNLNDWTTLKQDIKTSGQYSDSEAASMDRRYYQLTQQILPRVSVVDADPKSLQRDPFSLDEASLDGQTLTLKVTHSGGCHPHDYELFMSPATFLESFPVQANLWLQHEDHDDPCDAIVSETLQFDISPVVALHREQYGSDDTILLNIFGAFEETPQNKITIEYVP